jgi:hypothetical protein
MRERPSCAVCVLGGCNNPQMPPAALDESRPWRGPFRSAQHCCEPCGACRRAAKLATVNSADCSKFLNTDVRDLKDSTGKVYGPELYAAGQKPEGQVTEVSYMFPRPGESSVCASRAPMAAGPLHIKAWPAEVGRPRPANVERKTSGEKCEALGHLTSDHWVGQCGRPGRVNAGGPERCVDRWPICFMKHNCGRIRC